MNCETCVFWQGPDQRADFQQIWAWSRFVESQPDQQYGRCSKIPMGDSYEDAPDPLPLAVTKDGSDYRAELYTQATFGCVLWEERLERDSNPQPSS